MKPSNVLKVYGTLDMDRIYRTRGVRLGSRVAGKGGPPKYGKPMKQTYVYLRPSDIRTARRLGNGNLSAGIRAALDSIKP